MPSKTKIGVIGCGNISGIYLRNLQQVFETVEVAAVADLRRDRAQAQAAAFGVERVLDTEELVQDPDIDLVLNLTIPAAHEEICRLALCAGKPVYVEKPLAATPAEGRALLEQAEAAGLLLGCAPDTFMGAGIQTCLELIQSGAIGRPVGATAFMMCHGHESWHPDPAFYYQPGGGPMLDMGPYYLTALFALLGPARRVTGSASVPFAQRTITSDPKKGTVIDVEVPTHVAGILDMQSGAVVTILTSFDVWAAELPFIEVYGSEGTISLPDPNTFGGPVRLRRAGSDAFKEIVVNRPYSENSRGLGVADLARAMREGTADHRASGDLALHVLEAMHGFHLASEQNRHIDLATTFEPPAPLDKEMVY